MRTLATLRIRSSGHKTWDQRILSATYLVKINTYCFYLCFISLTIIYLHVNVVYFVIVYNANKIYVSELDLYIFYFFSHGLYV